MVFIGLEIGHGLILQTDPPVEPLRDSISLCRQRRFVIAGEAPVTCLLSSARKMNSCKTYFVSLAARRNARGADQNGEPEPESSSAVLSPVVLPKGEPSSAWWGQLTYGDGSREIEKQTAIEVCKIVLRETLGPLKPQRIAVEFKTEPVTLGDLQSRIQDLVGPNGWRVCSRKLAVNKVIIHSAVRE